MQTKSAGELGFPMDVERSRPQVSLEQHEQPRSTFLYRLEGVTPQAGKLREAYPTPTLGYGQSLSLTYRFDAGSFGLDVEGQATGESIESARESAGCLRRNLEYFFSRLGHYRFCAAVNKQAPLHLPWRVHLVPAGLMLRASTPIGFSVSHTPDQLAIYLPFSAAEQRRHDWLPRVGGLDSFEVMLSIDNDPRSVAIRAAAERLLHDPGNLGLTYPDGTTVHDRTLVESCLAWLAALTRQNPLLRVRCEVRAKEPLPEAMLQALSTAVYGSNSITEAGGNPATTVLDLREVTGGGASGNLLPDPQTLLGLGVPSLPPTRLPCRTSPQGVVLGYAGSGLASCTIRLSEQDRAQHCWILGATGTGKSTLLYQMIRADIERGAGVCLLDPHGDLFSQVLDIVPNTRLRDLVPIDVSATDRAVGINFLQSGGANAKIEHNFLINEMIQIFARLYDLRITGGPVFEQYMRNSLALAINNECKGSTLMDVPLIFQSAKFRDALLSTCTDPLVVSFWEEMATAATGDQSLHNMGPYITSKLNRFTTNALLRPIIGQSQSTVSFGECMAESRIVLINLAKGQLGGLDARLLGMLIMGLIFNAALRRTDQTNRRPFYLYVDEAQTFTTETVAELFAEARKFGLYLTLANQSLNQLRDSNGCTMTDRLLGNVGNLLAFRLGPPDAEFLARYMAPEINSIDLQDLPNHHLAARMLVEGAPVRPFVLSTEPPGGPGPQSEQELMERKKAIADQFKQYSRFSAEVEREIHRRKEEVIGASHVRCR